MAKEGAWKNRYRAKYTSKEINTLCKEILDFAKNSRAAHFSTWAGIKNKTKSWINNLAIDYPQFAQAYEDAKDFMAAKLVNSSIYPDESKFNAYYAWSYLPVYDKDYKAYLKWKSEIMKEVSSQENYKNVFNEWKEAQKNKDLNC